MKPTLPLLLLALALAGGLAAQGLPRKIIALQLSAVRAPAVDVNASISSNAVHFSPVAGLGYEAQAQVKLRVARRWYAVGALGTGGFRHKFAYAQRDQVRLGFAQLFPIVHLSTALGLEYHTIIGRRLVLLGGLHAQNNYYIRQTEESIHYMSAADGMSTQWLNINYSPYNTSAWSLRANAGVQWLLRQHLTLGLTASYMHSNFDVLTDSTISVREQNTALLVGTLRQAYRYLSADVLVGYFF